MNDINIGSNPFRILIISSNILKMKSIRISILEIQPFLMKTSSLTNTTLYGHTKSLIYRAFSLDTSIYLSEVSSFQRKVKLSFTQVFDYSLRRLNAEIFNKLSFLFLF